MKKSVVKNKTIKTNQSMTRLMNRKKSAVKNKTIKTISWTKRLKDRFLFFLTPKISDRLSAFLEYWSSLKPLLSKIKILNLDLDKEDFWKKTGLNWKRNVNVEGDLTQQTLLEIKNNQKMIIKIADNLDQSLLQKLLSSKVDQHLQMIQPLLADVQIFTPLNNLSIWQNTGLVWSEDFDKKGKIKEHKMGILLEENNAKFFLAIFEIQPTFLLGFLFQQIFHHWEVVRSDFCRIKKIFFPSDDDLIFWSHFELKKSFFDSNCCLKKEDYLLPLLQKRKVDLLKIKAVNEVKVQQFVLKTVLKSWTKNSSLLQKIKSLNLSLSSEMKWNNSGLNLVYDFTEAGKFSKEGEKKIGKYKTGQLLKIHYDFTPHFFIGFLKKQILNHWKILQNYLQKLMKIDSSFFQDSGWISLEIDIKRDLDSNWFFRPLTDEKIYSWKTNSLYHFFNLNASFLSKKIIDGIEIHWDKISVPLQKVLIFDKQKFIDLPVWKQTGLKIETDLQENCKLFFSVLRDVANFSLEQILAIKKINVVFLKKFFLDVFRQHWKNLVPVFKVAKSRNCNLSNQDFWFLTNLSWETDLQADGWLTANTMETILNKTIKQITAIKNLDAVSVREFLNVFSERKTELSVAKTGKKLVVSSFWSKVKSFFGFREKKQRSIQNRLENSVSLNSLDLHKTIKNLNDYKKRITTLKNLRRDYSNSIISDQDIVATGVVGIQPKRFIAELEGVTKYFLTGNSLSQVIQKTYLKIKTGDFVVVLGPSGAGKSTLLNLISGIDSPDGGDLFVDGINLTLLDEAGLTDFRRKYIGFVFQQYNLLQNLTAGENVDVVATLLPEEKEPLNMKEIFQLLGIETLLDKYPFQLSGGQQQRFSIARALAKNPDILFCDEPTGALDQEMSKKVMQILFKINQKYGTTIILVTHNQIFSQIAKTVFHFINGKVVKILENKKQLEPKDISFQY